MFVKFKIHFYSLLLYISFWMIANRLKHEHFPPRHMLSKQFLCGLFSLWGLECEHLSASCSLSERVYLQTSCLVEKSNPVFWPRVWFCSKMVEKPISHGKTEIFLYDGSPERMSTPGNDGFLDSTSTFICVNIFGIDEPTRQNLIKIQICRFWLEGFWTSTTKESIF